MSCITNQCSLVFAGISNSRMELEEMNAFENNYIYIYIYMRAS